MVKFVAAVMVANDMEVTYEEVAENTQSASIVRFYNNYYDVAFGVERSEEKESDKK